MCGQLRLVCLGIFSRRWLRKDGQSRGGAIEFRDRLLQEDEVAAVKWENGVNERQEAWRAVEKHKTKERGGKGVGLLLMQCA